MSGQRLIMKEVRLKLQNLDDTNIKFTQRDLEGRKYKNKVVKSGTVYMGVESLHTMLNITVSMTKEELHLQFEVGI